MTRKVCSLSAALSLALSAPGAALEVLPVYNATLMGGQYFFQSERASLNGNASVIAAPVLKTSDRWSFIPMYAGNYQGTKGVGDGVGAGTLFQQQMDHRASFMAIHNPEGSPWKFKPSMSYKRQFLKETRDETWGKGLFDFEKIALGFEAERVYRDPFSYRLGVDIFRIRFPNYQSLESKSGVDPTGSPLGRELASANVLDTLNVQLSASGSRPYPYEAPVVALSASYSFTYAAFDDQRIVNALGQFNDHKPYGRHDFANALNLSVGYPRQVQLWGQPYRLNSSFGMGASYLGSNQNTFDAARTRFVPDAYSYYSYSVGPGASLAWGDQKRPASVGASFRYSRLQYLGRLAQDGDGVYTPDHQYQDRYLVSLTYQYPIAPGFTLRVQSNFLWSRSNQTYEKTYPYNYRTANYLMGFTWEY